MEIVIGIGVGIALGIYISSQIKCHIRRNILKKNLKEYDKKKPGQPQGVQGCSVRETCMSNRFKTNALNLTRMTLKYIDNRYKTPK